MIVTTKKAYDEVSSLFAETFSKESKDEAKVFKQTIDLNGENENFVDNNRKVVPDIASDLYKIADSVETKAYTDSLPIEIKTALIERFILFLSELDKVRYKKIELPYSRNHRLKLILIDFNFTGNGLSLRHRF